MNIATLFRRTAALAAGAWLLTMSAQAGQRPTADSQNSVLKFPRSGDSVRALR